MAEGMIKTSDFNVTVDALDFVSKFSSKVLLLKEILGIIAMNEMAPGTRLRQYSVEGSLEASPAEGEKTPRSKFTVKESYVEDIELSAHAMEVTLDSIQKYGPDVALDMTSGEMLNKIYRETRDSLYNALKQGKLAVTATGFKQAIALGLGSVKNAFHKLDREATDFVVFANIMDAYSYLAEADLTIQKEFGLDYIKGFLGAKTVILGSDNEIAPGSMYVTATDNLQLNYMKIDGEAMRRAGLSYTVDSVLPILGYYKEGDHDTRTSTIYTLSGTHLWADLADCIAKVTFTGGYQPMSLASGTPIATASTKASK